MRCPFCSREAPAGSRYCPSCAAPLHDLSHAPTLAGAGRSAGPGGPAGSSSGDASWLSSSGSLVEGRFVPGTILGGRYRVIGLIGTGGMGEVYRANDLKLGQPVALKFLPEALAQDPSRIARFLNEVRIARQVSHPNVCRVYDLGESNGLHFLSMEYVDGEDLASLLRRIGRMPSDRAVQVARQLCAGLAAAHQQGILHRDLKPANVMIDGKGHARITDFGLAAAAHDIAPREVPVGTPAYMAPEQLAGQQVSVKSDIYALGLVLYEMFTGKPPFEADTPAEMLKTRQRVPPPSPSSVVHGIDPAVERAILRCIETDPRLRPASPLAVAAALPGGDPLAAALAAGETPSPEMVADAGEVGGLRGAARVACLAAILLGLPAMAWVLDRIQMLTRLDLPKPPEALEVEARQMIASFGYRTPPADSDSGFDLDADYLIHVQQKDASAQRWSNLRAVRPSPLSFWYRQSPRYLVPLQTSGFVDFSNPPAEISGMVGLRLDPEGRLCWLLAVPPQRDESVGPAVAPDWSPLFQAAGLQIERFEPTTPGWNPPINCGPRAAWVGEYPGQPRVAIRVEACAYGGLPAYFAVVAPWTKPRLMEPARASGAMRAAAAMGIITLVALAVAGALIARRNLRLGRSDLRGAFRVAAVVFIAQLSYWMLRIDHIPGFAEFGLALDGLSNAVFIAGAVWLIYIALEPSVRRLWPDVLISWNRLLAGRYRDPLVGHDILVGGVAGVIVSLCVCLAGVAGWWLGLPPPQPLEPTLEPLIGLREAVGVWIGIQVSTLAQPIGVLFLVLLLRVLLRRQWITVVVTAALFATAATLTRLEPSTVPAGTQALAALTTFLLEAAVWAVILVVLIRSGLLAATILFLVANSLFAFPPTLDMGAWYAARSWIGPMGVVVMAVYAFSIARAGRGAAWDDLLPG